MFYKQFLKITDIFNKELVEKFDYWLVTLPKQRAKNITASAVSSQFGIEYAHAKLLLTVSESLGILKKHYLVFCPDCNYILDDLESENIADYIQDNNVYCDECNKSKQITLEDICIAYCLVKKPDVSQEKITEEILRRITNSNQIDLNFNCADSLGNNTDELHRAYYEPSESAYTKLLSMKNQLDLNFNNTTEKGHALELLCKEMFIQIKGASCSTEVHTQINQIDCTALFPIATVTPSIFNYLSPYFIVECKNEPNKAPNNTYTNKLLSILQTSDAKLGIIVGRKKATSTCFDTSREHYLQDKKIIITFCDDDLEQIIERRVNLLDYLQFKIMQITLNTPKSIFDMFKGRSNT